LFAGVRGYAAQYRSGRFRQATVTPASATSRTTVAAPMAFVGVFVWVALVGAAVGRGAASGAGAAPGAAGGAGGVVAAVGVGSTSSGSGGSDAGGTEAADARPGAGAAEVAARCLPVVPPAPGAETGVVAGAPFPCTRWCDDPVPSAPGGAVTGAVGVDDGGFVFVCFGLGAGGAVEVGALVVGTGGVVVVVVLIGAVVVVVVLEEEVEEEEEEEEEEGTLACATNGQSAVAVTASSSTRTGFDTVLDHERTEMSCMKFLPQPATNATGRHPDRPGSSADVSRQSRSHVPQVREGSRCHLRGELTHRPYDGGHEARMRPIPPGTRSCPGGSARCWVSGRSQRRLRALRRPDACVRR